MFAGFIDEASGGSVVVVEMAEPAFADLDAGLTGEALAQNGITNVRRLSLKRSDVHVYLRGEQASAAGVYEKFIAVIRERGVTALVTANIPKAAVKPDATTVSEIERAFSSIRIAAAPAPLRDLFRLKDLGRFKPAGQRLGSARIFKPDGQSGPRDGSDGRPILIVAPSLDRRPVMTPAEQAARLLAGLPGLTSIRSLGQRSVVVAGLQGIEIEARAVDRETGAKVAVLQILLVAPEGGYFRIIGQVDATGSESYLPEFRRIAETFEIVR
jgi:hypothetical protein